jgi:CBS domain containing-hemolysin-like protein
MQTENPSVGNLLAELKKNIDRPLSAILTLNTIAHTVGAIDVGAQAGKLFGEHQIEMFNGSLSYESIIATVMTLAILFLSEIIPKTLGANNWKALAPVTARSLNVLMWILKPFVWTSNQLTRMLKKDKQRSVFSKLDFAAMADVLGESGSIRKEEYKLIKNILRFDELKARDVMTPRTVMVMANEEQTVSDFYEENRPFTFSRFPLYRENKDAITGLLLKNDLLQQLIDGKPDISLKSIKRDIVMVPETLPLRKIFDRLTSERQHLAVILDEYGGILGMVTQEDIIETLLGLEIMDETDKVTDLQKYARQKWEERARKMGLIV